MITTQQFLLDRISKTENEEVQWLLGSPMGVFGAYEKVSLEKQSILRPVGGGRHRFKGQVRWTANPITLQPKLHPQLVGVRWPAGTRGDAVRIMVNGEESRSMIAHGDLPGVVIQRASGGNRPGRGLLRYDADGFLSWRAPGSDRFGSSSRWTDETSWVLEDGHNPCAFIVVKVFEDRLPQGAQDAVVSIEDRYNNAIGQDNVDADEASGGWIEYYNMDLENVSPIKLLDFRVWLRAEAINNGVHISKHGGICSDTIWCGRQNVAIYQASRFSATVRDSLDVSGSTTQPKGVTLDGENVIWADYYWVTKKIFRGSGFSATILDSVDTTGISQFPSGVSWDQDANLQWCEDQYDLLIKASGFTATILDSHDMTATDQYIYGITVDDVQDTIWCGAEFEEHYKQSGFSATVKDSYNVTAINQSPYGMGWDGEDVVWCGTYGSEELYKQSGFSSTLQDSADIASIDNFVSGACHGDNGDRFQTWVQPTFIYHHDTLVWSDVAVSGAATVYVKRVTDPGTPSSPSRLNIHEHNWIGI